MTKIAVVVSSVGFHWEELYWAYRTFIESGIEVDLFTPTGIEAKADPVSLKHTGPLSLIGLGISRSISPETPWGQKLLAALNEVKSLIDLDTKNYKGLYLPGGHGCLFDINKNDLLHKKINEFYNDKKILSGVCHATSTFAFSGDDLVRGKKLTGFSDILDKSLVPLGLVEKDFLPIPYENEATLVQKGALVGIFGKLMAILNPLYIRIDLPFITGTGPKATKSVAIAVVKEL